MLRYLYALAYQPSEGMDQFVASITKLCHFIPTASSAGVVTYLRRRVVHLLRRPGIPMAM